MIIVIDDSVVDEEIVEVHSVQLAIEALYCSMGRGEHYVLTSRRVLSQLLKKKLNSRHVEAMLKWSLQNFSFLAGLPRQIPVGLVVVANGPTERISDGKWQTCAAEIARAGVRPTVLLAENSVDARIFTHAAKHYLLSQDLGSIQVSIEDRNGNGSGIAAELQNLIDRRTEWCLCISDSDLRCPDGSAGINAQQCESVASRASWPVNFRTTIGRELENDLPRTVLNEVVSTRIPTWERHSSLVEDACGVVLPYADIRGGTRPCDVNRFAVGTKERAYWSFVSRNYSKVIPEEEACTKVGECSTARGCTLLPSTGEGIGAAALTIFDGQSVHASYKKYKNASNIESWLELGRTVAIQGLSPKRMRL